MRSWVWAGCGCALLAWVLACSSDERDFGDPAESGGGSGGSGGGEAGMSGDGGMAGDQGSGGTGGTGGSAGSGGTPDPLGVVEAAPADGASTTPRAEITIRFSRAVDDASAASAVAVSNGQGAVTGQVEVDGDLVRFKPSLSLCYDEAYEVVVAETLSASDGGALEEPYSYAFTIPDGAWGERIDLKAAAGTDWLTAAIDKQGNAIAAWITDDVPSASYYSRAEAAWSDPEPVALTAGPVATVQTAAAFDDAGTAYVLWPEHGVGRLPRGETWQTDAVDSVMGTPSYIGYPGLAVTPNGTAAVVWDIQAGRDPGEVYASLRQPGGTWAVPTTPLGAAWSIQPVLVALPDDGFMIVYYNTPDPGTIGNLVARRYTPGSGWASPRTLGPGNSPALASNSAGDVVAGWLDNNTVLASVYSAASASWSSPVPLAPERTAAGVRVAIAGDGTAFLLYSDSDFSVTDYRVALRRYSGGSWSEQIYLDEATTNLATIGVLADDCGNALAFWTEGYSTYARRFTRAGGNWAPAILVAEQDGSYSVNPLAMNPLGEAVIVGATGDNMFPPEGAAAVRFE